MMKHLKLFEEMKIEPTEFPKYGHDLSPREKNILIGLVGQAYLDRFIIKVDDHYYYTKLNIVYYNVFKNFSELKDYILSHYYIYEDNTEEYLELLKRSNLDPSFDNNLPIRWASKYGHIEIVKHLLKDSRVNPSADRNDAIDSAKEYGHKEIKQCSVVKLIYINYY